MLESKSFLEKMNVLEHTIPFFLPLRDLENDHLSSNAKVSMVSGLYCRDSVCFDVVVRYLIFSLSF